MSKSKISNDPLVIVISAPSGAGKTTVVEALLKKSSDLKRVITHTTRVPRPGESDKKDYFFVSHDAFSKMILEKRFIEWAVVYNEKYGTSRSQIESILKKKKNAMLVIEEQGAKEIKKLFSKQSVFILLLPPNFKELESRMKRRQGMKKEDLEYRLKLAHQEIQSMSWYDYVIVNKDLERSIRQVSNIIECEKMRLSRNLNVLSTF